MDSAGSTMEGAAAGGKNSDAGKKTEYFFH
jgi:hypothetical protein